jgi:glycosyltransferase involved in cell wall biosynthesis
MLNGNRILFYLPALEMGGAERQAIYLARHLKNLGCDIRVWGNNGPGLASEWLEAMGIPWKIMPSTWPCRKRYYFRFLWRVVSTVHALREERPDVILAYCARPCISAGLASLFIKHIVFIWCQRDIYLPKDIVTKYAFSRADLVLCNANHEVKYLRNTFGEIKAPIYVIYNGIELSSCEKTSENWRAELNIPQDATVVSMVANFRSQKDHTTLLRAWKQVSSKLKFHKTSAYLLLAGAYQESYQQVFRLVAELDLSQSVEFLGQVNDISGLLAVSDIGVLSSPNEGLSNSILEYMASGLPVVASDIPGNREALGGHFDEQLYRPGDVQNLTDKLFAMIHSPERRQLLGAFNQKRANTEFSIEVMCKRMTTIVSNSIGNKTL